MKITKEAQMHLETADLLIRGIQQSVKINESKSGEPAPEHSVAAIKRRCVQIRQELLQFEQGVTTY